MKLTGKSPYHATFRREPRILRAETPRTDRPKHLFRPLFPRNPLFPASGPATGSFNGLHPKSKFLAIPAFLCLALGAASIAESAVVYGNLGVSGTNAITNTNTDMGPGPNFFIAQGFTTASPNLDVTSITLGLFGATSPATVAATVGIYADNFGEPAASPLYTSAVTNVGEKGLYNFSFTGAQLTNGSSYWVIPQSDVSWFTATSFPAGQNSSGYTFTQTQENNEGTGWVAAGSSRYSVSVQAVPEPTTYALVAIGIAAAGLARWRRRPPPGPL